MASNITSDLYSIYLEEVIKPQLGKPQPSKKSEISSDGSVDASSEKRVRQAVYDIRYRARREDIPLETAFTQYMAHTSMNSIEKNKVREKLGLTPGGAQKTSPVSEQNRSFNQKDLVVVRPVKGFGKPYRRYADPQKRNQLRKNPQIQSVEKTKYGTPYEGERKTGKITARVTSGKKIDQDGDGDTDFADVMSARMQASGVSKADANKKVANKPYNKKQKTLKVKTKNEYYSWREDLFSIFENLEDELNSSNEKQIKEKKVNNTVKINPDVAIEQKQFSSHIIESYELTEDAIYEKVDIATEYFYEQGLNEIGLNILIEDLGLDEFVSFVFEISENYTLSEARAGGVRVEPVTKGGKSVASLKGGAKSAAINRLRREKAARKEAEAKSSESKPSGFKSFSQKHTAVKKAKTQQPAKKPLKDRIAKGVLGAIDLYQKGMERHRAATATAGKALNVAAKGASEFGKGVASGVKTTTKVAKGVHKVLNNSYIMVDEKMNLASASMGSVVRDFQKSTAPQFKGKTKKERQKMAIAAKLEAERQARNESIDNTSSLSSKQQDTEEIQSKNAKSKLNRILAAKKTLQAAQQQAIRSGVTDLPS